MATLQPNPLQHFLLEQPWPVALTLLIVAAILFSVGAQRRQGKWQLAALGVAALAGGVVALAWAVTTDRQRVIAATDELLAATEGELDTAALDRLLAPDVVLTGPGGQVWLESEAIGAALRRAAERYGPVSHSVRQRQVGARDGRGRVELELRTELAGGVGGGAGGGVPVRSSWTLVWLETPGGWVVDQIEWRELQQRTPERAWLP